jgi:hypothetical protein
MIEVRDSGPPLTSGGLGPMPELKHRMIQTNGIQLHLAE